MPDFIFSLDIFPYRNIIWHIMARAATTSDVFNAVAEPRRRKILTLLAKGERSVNDVAGALRVRQPQASKHLRVLKHVGLVKVRSEGQQRLYAINGRGLKPIHEWTKGFEQFWNESFDRLDDYLAELQGKKKVHKP
jgi:DNA-binding transcriptional ArsR family regulator